MAAPPSAEKAYCNLLRTRLKINVETILSTNKTINSSSVQILLVKLYLLVYTVHTCACTFVMHNYPYNMFIIRHLYAYAFIDKHLHSYMCKQSPTIHTRSTHTHVTVVIKSQIGQLLTRTLTITGPDNLRDSAPQKPPSTSNRTLRPLKLQRRRRVARDRTAL